jgi:hypothetical protein
VGRRDVRIYVWKLAAGFCVEALHISAGAVVLTATGELWTILDPETLAAPLPAFVLLGRKGEMKLIRIIREGAESGVWGDEIAPKMIVAA